MEEQKVCNQIYKVQINHRKNHKSKSKKHIPLGDWRNKELRNNIRPTEVRDVDGREVGWDPLESSGGGVDWDPLEVGGEGGSPLEAGVVGEGFNPLVTCGEGINPWEAGSVGEGWNTL